MSAYVLITGACGGLGGEFCRVLAEGGNLFITGRSEERLAAKKAELLSLGANDVVTFAADLTDSDERRAMFAFADGLGIRFRAAYLVAGADVQKPFSDYTEQKLVFQVRLNAEATLSVAKGVLDRREEKFSLLVVSSMSGTTPMPYFAVYSATKAMLINFFTSLRYEYRDANITVLAPGGVPTRPDIVEDIGRQGLGGRLSSKPKEYVVKKALAGLGKNKRLVIPGLFNKVVYFAEKFLPMRVKCAFISRRWSKKTKDAF